jgi:hypothetical protein
MVSNDGDWHEYFDDHIAGAKAIPAGPVYGPGELTVAWIRVRHQEDRTAGLKSRRLRPDRFVHSCHQSSDLTIRHSPKAWGICYCREGRLWRGCPSRLGWLTIRSMDQSQNATAKSARIKHPPLPVRQGGCRGNDAAFGVETKERFPSRQPYMSIRIGRRCWCRG